MRPDERRGVAADGRPPAEVWDLVSDVTRIGEFSPETFEARWTRGSTGPEVGATFKGHVKRNGVGPTYWAPCTGDQLRAGARSSSSRSGPTTWPAQQLGLPAGADATAARWSRSTSGSSRRCRCALYWTLLGALRGRTNERGMRTTLERMKQVVEA